MGGFTLEYLINLRDQFSAAAERVMKSANDARSAIGNMSKTSAQLDGQLAKSAEGMNRIAASAERAGRATTSFSQINSRAAQESARFADLQIKQMNRVEKLEQSMYERHVARQNLIASGVIPGPREKGGAGIGFMGGMFALSMLHNDVLKDWEQFDDEMRKLRGTMAGQMSENEIAELRKSAFEVARGTRFSADKIADVFLEEASRGVPINQRTKNGQLLGAVIAKQMLGIATATGEDPSETFKTHLAIQRGFELPFEQFPHISDTIARIHQKTGVTLSQIMTQMGQVASFAHTAGWTEEQTVAAVGFLAKRGMGQFAGSGLSRLLSKSVNWSKPAEKIWKQLGIERGDLMDPETGGVIAPDKMIALLKDHMKNMPKAKQIAALNKLFGDRGEKIAAALAASDPAELRAMIEDLQHVDELAEKMGLEGSKGGAAGLAKFTAAWRNLKQQIGESGFGEHVGWLASKFGDMFDSIAGGSAWGKEAVGWTAGGLNLLSAAAMPLIALGTVGPWLVRGIPAIARGLSSVGASLLTMSNFGAIAANAGLLAGSLRVITGTVGVGLALGIGYEVVTHWQQIADAAERLWKALKEIASGNKKGIEDAANVLGDANETLGKKAADPKKMGPFDNPFHTLAYGIPEENMWINLPKKFNEWFGFIGDSPPPGATFNPKAHHFNPRGAPSAADAAANAQAAASQRVQADVNVRSIIDPIQVTASPLTVNVQVSGRVDAVQGSGSGSTPLAASHPRGQTMAEPAAPRVSK